MALLDLLEEISGFIGIVLENVDEIAWDVEDVFCDVAGPEETLEDIPMDVYLLVLIVGSINISNENGYPITY